jgi:hypothetical protein
MIHVYGIIPIALTREPENMGLGQVSSAFYRSWYRRTRTVGSADALL